MNRRRRMRGGENAVAEGRQVLRLREGLHVDHPRRGQAAAFGQFQPEDGVDAGGRLRLLHVFARALHPFQHAFLFKVAERLAQLADGGAERLGHCRFRGSRSLSIRRPASMSRMMSSLIWKVLGSALAALGGRACRSSAN
jgi:hypothetical protein